MLIEACALPLYIDHAAFSGQYCEEDRNGCSEVECYEGVECLDIPAPGTGAVCAACPPGLTGDGLKCYGIKYLSHLHACVQLSLQTTMYVYMFVYIIRLIYMQAGRPETN